MSLEKFNEFFLGLREYAITSALKDSRFSPITRDELPRLTVSVSILQVIIKLLIFFEIFNFFFFRILRKHVGILIGPLVFMEFVLSLQMNEVHVVRPLTYLRCCLNFTVHFYFKFKTLMIFQVATEQGWDQIQTIDSLLRKGGYRGQITQDTRRSIKLTRYTSTECQMSYNEYREHTERNPANHYGKVQC